MSWYAYDVHGHIIETDGDTKAEAREKALKIAATLGVKAERVREVKDEQKGTTDE